MTLMEWALHIVIVLVASLLAVYICRKVRPAKLKTDAILKIDTSDPEKDHYNFMILTPIDDIQKKPYLYVEVKVDE